MLIDVYNHCFIANEFLQSGRQPFNTYIIICKYA